MVQILRLKKYTYIQKMDAMKAFSLQKEKEEVMLCGIFYFSARKGCCYKWKNSGILTEQSGWWSQPSFWHLACAPLFNRANSRIWKQASAHAYSGFTVRFCVRMALWIGSRRDFAFVPEPYLRYAVSISHRGGPCALNWRAMA